MIQNPAMLGYFEITQFPGIIYPIDAFGFTAMLYPFIIFYFGFTTIDAIENTMCLTFSDRKLRKQNVQAKCATGVQVGAAVDNDSSGWFCLKSQFSP